MIPHETRARQDPELCALLTSAHPQGPTPHDAARHETTPRASAAARSATSKPRPANHPLAERELRPSDRQSHARPLPRLLMQFPNDWNLSPAVHRAGNFVQLIAYERDAQACIVRSKGNSFLRKMGNLFRIWIFTTSRRQGLVKPKN